MNLTEKPLSSEYPYRGKIVNMRVDQALLPNGRQAVREVVEHPGGVCVAALTDREELLFGPAVPLSVSGGDSGTAWRASAPPERTRWNAASGS